MCIIDEDMKEIFLNISGIIGKCVIPRNMLDKFYLDYGCFFIHSREKYDFCACVTKDIGKNIKKENSSFITKLNNRCYISDSELIFWGRHVLEKEFYLEEFRKYFIALISWILHRDKNMILLHASAIEVCGKCILFAGNSNCGKTSIAMNMIKNGATYISNDLTFLYIEDNKVMVLGVPQKITMDKKTYDYCDINYVAEQDINRIYINPSNQFKIKVSAELNAIVLLSKDVKRKDALLERVNFNEAVARLISKIIHSYKWGFKPYCRDYGYFSVLNRVMKCIEKKVLIYYMIWGKNHFVNYNIIMKQIVENEGRI